MDEYALPTGPKVPLRTLDYSLLPPRQRIH